MAKTDPVPGYPRRNDNGVPLPSTIVDDIERDMREAMAQMPSVDPYAPKRNLADVGKVSADANTLDLQFNGSSIAVTAFVTTAEQAKRLTDSLIALTPFLPAEVKS